MANDTVARKSVLPVLVVTETCDKSSDGAVLVSEAEVPYFTRPIAIPIDGGRRDGLPSWAPAQFNLFPMVLCGDGSPWAEACLFILSGLENSPTPDMRTFEGYALDLAAFRRFIEAETIDWMNFPANKRSRPTYRFRAHLNIALEAGEIKPTTVNRRMGTMVAFYRWLEGEGLFQVDNKPWLEQDVYITVKDRYGFKRSHTVRATDLSVRVPKQDDPFDEFIQDGGKLRPLPQEEQEWLLEALAAADNPEMTLIHLMGLLTGARLQSICTMRLRHVAEPVGNSQALEVRLPIGPGTGIDTKGDKRMVLHIPVWLYQALHTYAHSERAQRRRNKAGRDDYSQYLFLTQHGSAFYASTEERQKFNPNNKRRYDLDGGAVGTFIRTVIRPNIEQNKGVKLFSFRFHDTRATFGMNLTDAGMIRVESGVMSLGELREYVKTRMGHESSAITDLYLNYRRNLKLVRGVLEEHESHLKQLCQKAMLGML